MNGFLWYNGVNDFYGVREMTIGQRILQARQASGLSQRELAGDVITRNMLSAIEHDKARPSLETLQYLSRELNRPVGWFLGEDVPQVEGFEKMVLARECYDGGKYRDCLEQLRLIPAGEVLERERALLEVLATLALAEQALMDGRRPFARKLLEKPLAENCPYYTEEMERKRQLLRVRAGLDRQIPEEQTLLLRAETAVKAKRFSDARRYLEALDDRDNRWYYLMGETLFGLKDYAAAAKCYHRTESAMGKAVRRRLQLCYAELKDFEKAYYYATMEME